MNPEIKRDVEPPRAACPAPEIPPGTAELRWPERIQILFIAVNDAQGGLRLDKEHRAIRKSLDRWPDRFTLAPLLGVQIDEIGEELRRYSPDVLHFCGHGTSAGELAFPDGSGAISAMSADAFEALLRALGGNIKLAVLNACFSMHQARAVCDLTGIAIGMHRQISDDAAIAFSRALYGALADSRSVRDAFELARAEIRVVGKRDDADVPELFVRPGLDASRIHLPRISPPIRRPPRLHWPTTIPVPSIWIWLLILFAIGLLAGARKWVPDGGDDFAVKVKFIDEARQPVKLTGTVRLESEAYTPTVPADNADLVELAQVPRRMAGKDASFTVESPAFRVAAPLRRYPLQANGIIYLELQRIMTRISGTISLAGKRLPGGEISLAGLPCSGTIRDGFFEIPCAGVRLPVKAQVREPVSYARQVCGREIVLHEETNNELELVACPSPSPLPTSSTPSRPSAPSSASMPSPCVRSPEELIRREAELVRRHDLAGVVSLFAPGAVVRDDKAATQQSPYARYRAELARHRFLTASHANIQCEPASAGIAFCASSSAGSCDDGIHYDNPPGSDRWTLENRGGCWRIRSLAINAAGKSPGL